MKYSTFDYFSDSLGFLEDLDYLYKSLKIASKKIYNKLLDIDYYYHTVKILQSLPEAAVIVFLGTLFVYNLLKHTESAYGNKIYPIITPSMAPEITPGSLVYTNPAVSYSVGDIVSYVEKTPQGVETGKILTHRIIDVNSKGKFITKGDANPDPDHAEVSISQIQGKVLKSAPLLGYLEVIIRTLPGFLILVAVPSFYLINNQLKYLKNFFKKY